MTHNDHSVFIRIRSGSSAIVDPATFSLPDSDEGAARVFTTFASVFVSSPGNPAEKKPALLCLEYHLERLLGNARAVGILRPELPEHSAAFLIQAITTQLRRFVAQPAGRDMPVRVRVVLDQDGIDLFCEFVPTRWPRGTEIAAVTVVLERAQAEIKSTRVLALAAARERAMAAGAQEAILINREGRITEGTWTNVFWYDAAGKLFTPKSDVLPGVTRRLVIENFDCELRDIDVEDWKREAKEVFVTQSTTGITPVVMIDGARVGSGHCGPLTRAAQLQFDALVEKLAIPLELK